MARAAADHRDKAKGRGMSAAADACFARCFEILKGRRSKTGRAWREGSTRDRRLLLAVSGRAGLNALTAVDMDWEELPEPVRAQIVAGLRRFKRWADEVCPE